MKKVLQAALILASSSFFLSNSNGYAESSGEGLTGAPNDAVLANGSAKTCQFCHNNGTYNASATLSLFNEAGTTAVTQYEAGKIYTIRLTVNAASGTPNGYGFQMIDIQKSNNANIKGFVSTQPTGIKLSTLPNGRIYAEHSVKSTAKTFDIKWKAPTTNIGTVTFYAVGNAVNGNGTTAGDNGTASVKIDFPSLVSDIKESKSLFEIGISPNPSQDLLNISFISPQNTTVSISLIDISGRQIMSDKWELQTGKNNKTWNIQSINSGIYSIQISNNHNIVSKKLLKI